MRGVSTRRPGPTNPVSNRVLSARKGAGRLTVVGCLAAAAVAAAPPAAEAMPPDSGQFFYTDTFVDSDVCAPDGFAVDVTETESGTYTVFLHSDGSFAGALVHLDYTATISANGRTIEERDRWQTYYFPDGSSREVGLTVHIQGPGIVQRDAGQIRFNSDGSVADIRGPHPQFLGETFCFALQP